MKQFFSAAQRRRIPEYLLLGGVLFTLLWHFVHILQFYGLPAIEAYLPMLWGGLAALLLRRGHTWQRKSFWLLAISLGYIFLHNLLMGRTEMEVGLTTVANGLLAFGVYYQLAFGFTKERLRSFLSLSCGLWVLLESLLALCGILAALYDQTIYTAAGSNLLGLKNSRLHLLIYATITASNLTVAFLLGCLGLALTRRPLVRGLYLLGMLILAFALGLTVTRTGYLTLGLGVGLCLASLALPRLRTLLHGLYLLGMLILAFALGLTVTRTGYLTLGLGVGLCLASLALPRLRTLLHGREWLVRLLCLAMVALVILTAYFALNATISLFNGMHQSVQAAAEEAVQQRPLQFNTHLLTERQYIWKGVYRYFRDNPQDLLFGVGVDHATQRVQPYTGSTLSYFHAHSIYLQALLEFGLVGLALLLLVLWRFARASLRLLLHREAPLWQRMLPILPIMVLVADLAECLLMLNCGYPALYFCLLLMGMTLRFGGAPDDLLPAYRPEVSPCERAAS